MANPKNLRAAVVLAVTGSLLLAAFAVAPAADASTLYACVKTKSGSARVFTKKPKCKKGETKISWNTAGIGGAKGISGVNGVNGTNGTNGKEGVPGQPQSAFSFNQTLEAGLLEENLAPVFSVDGVSVKLGCEFAIGDLVALDATGPAGTRAESGMVDERANGKGEPTQSPQQLIRNVAVSTTTTTDFASLLSNVSGEVKNVGHVNATISTPSAVIVIDAFIEAFDPCTVSGVAFSIPT